MEKVSLRHIYIEIGRMCNLKCEHCCKGDPENIQISDEVIDVLLDNVHFIDEITITGGEPMLYIERMRTLLNKCKNRNIKVNYFNVITNCTIKSDDFVELFNDWIDYCTFGNENKLTISTDKYHKEYISKYLRDCDIEENIEWYKAKLKECKFLPSTEQSIDNDILIFNEGRVRNWTEERKNKYIQIKECKRKKTRSSELRLKKVCEGEENICKYGCVYNCIRDVMYLNPYGDMFYDTFVSYKLQKQCEDICIGNICSSSIYDIVTRWNKDIKSVGEREAHTTLKDERFGELIDRTKESIYAAEEFAKNGLFDKAKEELDKITLYKGIINTGRNEFVDNINSILEILEEDETLNNELKEKHEKEYKDFLLAYNTANITYKSIENISKQMKDMYKNLENRKSSNKPGSLFVDPDIDFYNSYFGLLSGFFSKNIW